MDIEVLASSSRGNCYVVGDGDTRVMLECGISINEIRLRAGCRLSDISACLVTHEHKDHCRAVADVLACALPVYMSAGTAEALGLGKHHRLYVVKALEQFRIGSMVVLPISVQHDAVEPLGFLLYSCVTKEKLLFVTDTHYVLNRFDGLNYIMIECNYSLRTLCNGCVDDGRIGRLLTSHMSLENCIGFLQANDLRGVKEICLLHLSDDNSDEELFVSEVMKATGRPVYVARR